MGTGRFIEIQGLSKTFQTPSGPFTALKDVSLSLRKGRRVALVGKSGSGKSTLLNMITGIDRPTTGLIVVGDTPVHALSEGSLAQWRGKNVGVVFQFFQLLPTLTVLENVLLPMDFTNSYPRKERHARARALLEEMGIAEQAGKLPAALSGGQQQRAAIARALANNPPLLVADEPTGNLDSHTAEEIFELFARLSRQGTTVLVVTHERELSRYFEETISIADGAITSVSGATRTAESRQGGHSHVSSI
ncbi:MAG: ABC transporter ATP-binding protein [Nitrospinae bacterium]|nr:ABC transporter ATP-binding protein [Nitrospinota bacterium]